MPENWPREEYFAPWFSPRALDAVVCTAAKKSALLQVLPAVVLLWELSLAASIGPLSWTPLLSSWPVKANRIHTRM